MNGYLKNYISMSRNVYLAKKQLSYRWRMTFTRHNKLSSSLIMDSKFFLLAAQKESKMLMLRIG